MAQLEPIHLLLPALLASGWAADHRFLRHRLSGARRDPLSGLLTRAGWTARARRITRGAAGRLGGDGFVAALDVAARRSTAPTPGPTSARVSSPSPTPTAWPAVVLLVDTPGCGYFGPW